MLADRSARSCTSRGGYCAGRRKRHLNLLGGADVVTVTQTLAGTTTTINGGDGDDTTSIAPGADVNGIAGKVIVNGNANNDTLNVDDADAGPDTGFITPNRIWGFEMPGSDASNGGITYAVENLNLRLGVRADTVNVLSTAAGTVTTVDLGVSTTNSNIVNVASNAPATTGDVNGIAGKLVVNGQSSGTASDTLNLYDTDAGSAEMAFVTATRIWGLDMPGSDATNAGITYSGIEALNLNLGTRADTVNVLSTAAGSTVTIKTGSTSANTVNVGSTAPAAGGISTHYGQL